MIRLAEAQLQKASPEDMKKPEQLERVKKVEGWREELKLFEGEKGAESSASWLASILKDMCLLHWIWPMLLVHFQRCVQTKMAIGVPWWLHFRCPGVKFQLCCNTLVLSECATSTNGHFHVEKEVDYKESSIKEKGRMIKAEFGWETVLWKKYNRWDFSKNVCPNQTESKGHSKIENDTSILGLKGNGDQELILDLRVTSLK